MKYSVPFADITWRNDNTPESLFHSDIYYPCGKGVAAAEHVFLRPNNLPERWQKRLDQFVIGELGFGTGLNFFVTAKQWAESGSSTGWLHFISCENRPLQPEALKRATSTYPELKSYVDLFLKKFSSPLCGIQRIDFESLRISLTLLYGDAQKMWSEIDTGRGVDAWYLDGFAPGNNPDMWSEEIARIISHHSAPGATFGTFSAAGDVRRRFEAAGFQVEKFPGFSGKRESLRGELKSKSSYMPPGRAPTSVAVIGGGLAGACMARALTKRGVHTHVIERQSEIARGASGNPAGVLLPYMTARPTIPSRFYLKAYQYALNVYPDELLQRDSILHFPSTDRLEKLIDNFDQIGMPSAIASVVSPETIAGEHSLQSTSKAFHYPMGAWVRPRELCEHLMKSCSNTIELTLSQEAILLSRHNELWQVCNTHGDVLCRTEAVILSNAFEARQFAQSAWLPVEAVRGQLVQAQETSLSSKLRTILCYDGYCLPSDDGLHTLGASYSHHNLSPEPSDDDTVDILTRLIRWCPQLKFSPPARNTRVAFRTTTYDRFPLLGRLPEYDVARKEKTLSHYEGLYVATGFGSRGLISCPLSSEILAAQIFGEPVPIETDIQQALCPARYIERCLQKDTWK